MKAAHDGRRGSEGVEHRLCPFIFNVAMTLTRWYMAGAALALTVMAIIALQLGNAAPLAD
jgi:hypothetical protein